MDSKKNVNFGKASSFSTLADLEAAAPAFAESLGCLAVDGVEQASRVRESLLKVQFAIDKVLVDCCCHEAHAICLRLGASTIKVWDELAEGAFDEVVLFRIERTDGSSLRKFLDSDNCILFEIKPKDSMCFEDASRTELIGDILALDRVLFELRGIEQFECEGETLPTTPSSFMRLVLGEAEAANFEARSIRTLISDSTSGRPRPSL